MLKSLDLFSGIGGLTLALRGAAEPVAYCEVSPRAQTVLRANMASGRLPPAPICDDVQDMGARWLATHVKGAGGAAAAAATATRVDLVTAGFPCTGMSVAGHRRGFAHAETALFYELLRVVDEVRPRALFLENSNNILRVAVREVAAQLTRRGYELRYTLLSACDVGALHRRRRWFCLAVRAGDGDLPSRLSAALGRAPSAPEYDWSPTAEPARMDRAPVAARTPRFEVLGMAVVPAAARHALRHLARAWNAPTSVAAAVPSAPQPPGAPFPPAAFIAAGRRRGGGGTVQVTPEPPDDGIPGARRDLKLVLDPALHKPRAPPQLRLMTSGLVTRPVRKQLWATPTKTYSAVGYLTGRNHQCLMSQVRFERRTRDREGYLSPAFVEWLMGFPLGWTDALSRGVTPRANR